MAVEGRFPSEVSLGSDARYFPHPVSFSTPNRFNLLYGRTETSQLFSRGCVSARDAPGLRDGSIWPKTGCASIA
jgi:hypothetical protein